MQEHKFKYSTICSKDMNCVKKYKEEQKPIQIACTHCNKDFIISKEQNFTISEINWHNVNVDVLNDFGIETMEEHTHPEQFKQFEAIVEEGKRPIVLQCPECKENFEPTEEQMEHINKIDKDNCWNGMHNSCIRADMIWSNPVRPKCPCCGENYTGWQDNLDKGTYYMSCKNGCRDKVGLLSELLPDLGLQLDGEKFINEGELKWKMCS